MGSHKDLPYFCCGISQLLIADSSPYLFQVQDIESSLGTIREKMSRSRHLQDQLKAFEYRDRSVAEHNFERINFW